MRRILWAVRRAVDDIVRWVVIVLMLLMTVAVCLQILFRYVFNIPLGWSEEMARFAFVWVSFFGASALMRIREHINVAIFVDRFPTRLRAIAVFLANLVAVICVYFFIVGGVALTTNEWRQLAPAMEIAMGWVYLAIPISSGLMGIWVLIQTIEAALQLGGSGRR